MSLLEPKKQSNGYYIDTMFNIPTDSWYWVWSADRRIEGENGSPSAAWVVYFNLGLVDWSGLDRKTYVRCVRS
jgi:hypothetical protein